MTAAKIEELVLRLNAVPAKEGMDVGDPGGNATDDQVAETLQEVAGYLSRDEITQEIESMIDEQKDALVALFWIGRDDTKPADWEETKALARQQHDGLVSRYLLGQPDAGEFLTEGLKKCWNLVSAEAGVRPVENLTVWLSDPRAGIL